MNVMKQIKYLIFLIAAVIFSSCGSVQKSTTFRADDMRLNVGMNDLVYLGESEITVRYNVYLGCITVIDEVNGEDYSSLDVKKTSLGNVAGILSGPISRAAYKVLNDYPEATYFLPVFNQSKVDRLFLGREISETAKIRAYKLK